MKWIWIKFEKAVGHLVAEPFVEAVKSDLRSRDCGEIEEEEEKATFYLDPGGMVLVGEPMVQLEGDIDGLTVSGLARALESFAGRAANLETRDGGYVKLHSMYSCLCMSPEQRDILVDRLKVVGESAYAQYEVHFQKWMAARE